MSSNILRILPVSSPVVSSTKAAVEKVISLRNKSAIVTRFGSCRSISSWMASTTNTNMGCAGTTSTTTTATITARVATYCSSSTACTTSTTTTATTIPSCCWSNKSRISGGSNNDTILLPLMVQRSFVSETSPLCSSIITVKVPTMGDSITEGTIVEWAVPVGKTVQEEDVVAMIETDKVTIEIKATMSGVITRHFGNVDETVEVGADLYEIDTTSATVVAGNDGDTVEEEASPNNSSPSVSNPEEATTATVPPSMPTASTTTTTATTTPRIPSIQFLGKLGWERMLSSAAASTKTNKEDSIIIPANYGRLNTFSEEEMEAILMGGANVAPKVKEYASGGKFEV